MTATTIRRRERYFVFGTLCRVNHSLWSSGLPCSGQRAAVVGALIAHATCITLQTHASENKHSVQANEQHANGCQTPTTDDSQAEMGVDGGRQAIAKDPLGSCHDDTRWVWMQPKDQRGTSHDDKTQSQRAGSGRDHDEGGRAGVIVVVACTIGRLSFWLAKSSLGRDSNC